MNPPAERLFEALVKCLAYAGVCIPLQEERNAREALALYESYKRQQGPSGNDQA